MNWMYFSLGLVVGWIIKVPFLIKWYRELKRTTDYKKAREDYEYDSMVERYNLKYPNKPLKKI